MAEDEPRKPPSRFSFSGSRRLLAGLAPTATFLRGKLGGKDGKLTPAAEAHLCQLAALENYADHGMFVKFSDDEAAQLEQRALDLAVKESREAKAGKRGAAPARASQTFSKEEADALLAQLRTPHDPLFAAVAPSLAAGAEPATPSAAAAAAAAAAEAAGGEQAKPAKRSNSFAAFKRRLLPGLRRGGGGSGGKLTVPQASSELPPGTLGQGYSPGSYDHFQAEAADRGMEYSNGFIFPPDDSEQQQQQQQQQGAAGGDAGKEEALLAVALSESREQAELDAALRDAKALRADLRFEAGRLGDKAAVAAEAAAVLEQKAEHAGGLTGAPRAVLQELAKEQARAQEMRVRADALAEGCEELGHLQAYIQEQQPPRPHAIALTETILQELLARLNKLGFAFQLPSSSAQQTPRSNEAEVDDLLAKYRSTNPTGSPPAELAEVSDASSSEEKAEASEDSQPLRTPRAATPPRPQPAASGSASPPAAPNPFREHSVGRASQRLQKASEASPAGSRGHARGLSLERSPSVASSRSWERLRLSAADAGTLKRSPQVVHLFNEMRKVLPHAMGPPCAEAAGPPRRQASLPAPGRADGAAAAAARSAEASEAAKAGAEKHARLIARAAASLGRARPGSMAEAAELAGEVRQQLASVQPDADAVLAASPAWPADKWGALCSAVETHAEVEALGSRMREWSLGQGSWQEEARAAEACLDASRAALESLQERARRGERAWQAGGVPWEGACFRQARVAALQLALLCMSRALVEVANLERSQRLQADACIRVLADAVRVAYKAHQLAGGFTADAGELWERVKALAQYYVRSRDPTWLRDNSRLTG